jgi:16S rRNA (cytosine967-C5)-methyltransferase
VARPAAKLPSGLLAREMAARTVAAVLTRGRALDDALVEAAGAEGGDRLEPRDRAFVRLLSSTVLRRTGELDAVMATYLDKPLAEKQRAVRIVLLLGAAQLLILATPPHAAISLAVELCRRTPGAGRFDKLVNAVLRRVSATGAERLRGLAGARLDIPRWLWDRWVAAYGEDVAERIAAASICEAPLDISVKADAAAWAERLGGTLLPTGSVRLEAGGRVDELAGFAEGAWWVQDAAAALPAKLLGPVAGLSVADLCAAPGGKTAELAAAGARVTAVDVSQPRLARVRENLARLRLEAETLAVDIVGWQTDRRFDAVLLDAPCTATGTIRRHPDILHLKRSSDIAALSALQARLLERAVALVRPGGTIVYCTCSLEPEEGVRQIDSILAQGGVERCPIRSDEVGGQSHLLTEAGDLRTLPFHHLGIGARSSGLDGFYAARLTKTR